MKVQVGTNQDPWAAQRQSQGSSGENTACRDWLTHHSDFLPGYDDLAMEAGEAQGRLCEARQEDKGAVCSLRRLPMSCRRGEEVVSLESARIWGQVRAQSLGAARRPRIGPGEGV